MTPRAHTFRPARLVLAALLLAAAALVPAYAAADQPTLVFKTGFDGDSRVDPAEGTDDQLVGIDRTAGPKSDPRGDLGIDQFTLQYTGGDSSLRHARIVPDPADAINHVLEFWIGDSWSASENQVKARVQANFYEQRPGYREFYQSVRVWLHTDFAALRNYPRAIHWLTLAEFWNNRYWGGVPHGFRITFGVGKPSAESGDLRFIVDAQGPRMKPIWKDKNNDIAVPIGRWFTLEYYLREGDAQTGRFYAAMTPDGGPRRVIYDLAAWTQNPDDPAPDGLTDWNPIKLYTSKELVAFLKSQNKALRIHWDDLALWTDRRPADSRPRPPAITH